jgi:mono/diheme cytochrome c family protein
MFMRIFLLSILVFSTATQAQSHAPGKGWYPCEEYPGNTMRYRGHGMGHRYWKGDRHHRGGGFRGPRMGGQRCGGHSWWDVPIEEARRLNPIEVSPQSLVRGETLYRENCSRCHGDDGFGDGPQAKGLRVPPANLHHAGRHYSDGALFYIIRKGRDPMPAWEDKLSEGELWNLINYLRFQLGAHRHGPRFGYYLEQYQSTEAVSYEQTDQMQQTKREHPDHQAMDHDDMQGENCNLNQSGAHDDQRDE